MSWAETIRTAYEGIRTRRLRSALTMLGILIGIAAVILTVGLGEGAQRQVADQIGRLGSNLLIVTPGSTTSSTGIRGGGGSATTLTAADASALADPAVAPDLFAVAATASGRQTLTANATNWTSSVLGTSPAWLSVRARSLSNGRFFTDSEAKAASRVTLLGSTTAE